MHTRKSKPHWPPIEAKHCHAATPAGKPAFGAGVGRAQGKPVPQGDDFGCGGLVSGTKVTRQAKVAQLELAAIVEQQV